MPRKNYRRYKKKPIVAARSARFQKGKYLPNLSMVADQQPITFRYYQQVKVTTSLLPTTYTFAGNFCNDPDIIAPLVGIVPLGWTEWSRFFKRAYITSSKIVIKGHNPNVDPVRVACFPSNAIVTPATMESAIAKPRSKNWYLGNYNNLKTMKNSATTKAATGIKMDPSGNSFDVATSPVVPPLAPNNPFTQWYWHLVCQCTDPSIAIAMDFEVEVMYNVTLFDRRNIQPNSVTQHQLDIGSSAA